MLTRVKQSNPQIKTKSGLMLGLGETQEELLDVLADLLDADVRLPDAGAVSATVTGEVPAGRALRSARGIR